MVNLKTHKKSNYSLYLCIAGEDVLEFNTMEEEWDEIGHLQDSRYNHAAAVIEANYDSLCQEGINNDYQTKV